MKPIKALVYLENRALFNRIRNYSRHKLQIFFLILLVAVLFFMIASIQTGQTVEMPDYMYRYADTAIGLLILVSIISSVINADNRLPIHINPTSTHLVFGLPLTSQQLCFYYFGKQFAIQLCLTLVFSYGAIAIMGRTILPAGMFFTWLGVLLLTFWINALGILLYSIFRRFQLNGKILLWMIFILLAVRNFFLSPNPGLSSFWQQINPATWWPGAWFHSLTSYVLLQPGAPPGIALAGTIVLSAATAYLARLLLPDCRHELLKLSYRTNALVNNENRLSNPEEAWLKFFGAGKGSVVAEKTFSPGTGTAIIWKELITWERLKPVELKYGFLTVIVIGVACGFLVTYQGVPAWIVLIVAPMSGFGGGKPVLNIKHTMVRQMQGSWLQKLAAIILLPIVENIGFHFMALIAFGVALVILNGISGLGILLNLLFPLLMLILGLNVLCLVWGALSTLVGFHLIGAFRLMVKFIPIIVHFIIVIMAANLYQWATAAVTVLFAVIILWSLLTLWVTAVFLDKTY